ncbi:hypothetical protein [Aliiruegeria lutimaris]|uniref:Uncharacterized protein n=1 Tax=Aliiruegeria lutimaris TaxID=571298 RepID=A0A1G9MEC9_9RHOB|nr:hypothetical protein [Aliiruegeria lutimaris]SDL72626.1 hypothetical protein SAMN04488026_110910 [Aliiruegeria lutimaris]
MTNTKKRLRRKDPKPDLSDPMLRALIDAGGKALMGEVMIDPETGEHCYGVWDAAKGERSMQIVTPTEQYALNIWNDLERLRRERGEARRNRVSTRNAVNSLYLDRETPMDLLEFDHTDESLVTSLAQHGFVVVGIDGDPTPESKSDGFKFGHQDGEEFIGCPLALFLVFEYPKSEIPDVRTMIVKPECVEAVIEAEKHIEIHPDDDGEAEFQRWKADFEEIQRILDLPVQGPLTPEQMERQAALQMILNEMGGGDE